MKNYLLFVTLPYAYSIMRPLQDEIRRRGDRAAWFIEEGCADGLLPGEERLHTIREVEQFAPVAVFTPGNYIPDFFPGIKVQLFHGYPINKRNDRLDDHFTIRGWFDIYCTQGPSSTAQFQEQQRRLNTFRIYETGWPKADFYFRPDMQSRPTNNRPTILYSSTFTRSLTSTPILADTIERIVAHRDWNWIFMFHPKLDDTDTLSRYEQIAARNENARYLGPSFDFEALRQADVMLCDSSSIILEFMFLDKPVVTFRNSHPGPHLLDVNRPEEVGPALEKALSRPDDLMGEIRAYTMHHEPHRDCLCSARVLDAVDDFRAHRSEWNLRPKPLNLIRKIKLRRRMHYPLLKGLFR